MGFMMLTCGFGVAVTPMILGVLGDATNRLANRLAPSHTFTYVDDFFEAGTFTDTISTDEAIIHETVDKVLGPEGLSVKKNVDAQITDILGILINFLSATMRPKDKAIEKLFFVRAIQHRC